jgi:AraC-like DNA-binding protein
MLACTVNMLKISTSPGSFHMKSNMDRACEILRNPDQTIRTVAGYLGFCDEFHFSRRFKQIVGLSPTQFRRQISRSGQATMPE